MKLYGGVSALSASAQKRLLDQLQQLEPAISGVSAEYLHFVDASQVNAKTDGQLKQLLTYGSPFDGAKTKNLLLALPRPGTISPWSSKATDIIHNSGLSGIKRLERGTAYYLEVKGKLDASRLILLLHDRMTEVVLTSLDDASQLFKQAKPAKFKTADILGKGRAALVDLNRRQGLALADDEIDYLYNSYKALKRNPTDAELMMFGVVNSEHCRHKIFNADWVVDGAKQPKSLFKMIRNTYEKGGQDVLSAYSDNAAVLKGQTADQFWPDQQGQYQHHDEPANLVIKVETHNHPTAIAPFQGAATGIGGEIRDEAATGRGARTKMGLAGFNVSNLNLPGAGQPWEKDTSKPEHIASALDIMLQAPIGGAAFSNEFGRPTLTGYFRSYEQTVDGERRGYHKPLMAAGGLGNILSSQVEKGQLPVGAQLIVLGGPAMLIGLAGGAAASMQTGASDASLDFASVQRANAEMQRRAQEVINTCWRLGKKNPIISIHDVGAGGISNALPELVHDSGRGAHFELRDIPNDDPGMSPMEIWSNESQERYVLGIANKDLPLFKALCARERCPLAVVGEATAKQQLVLHDNHFDNTPVNIPMSLLFGKPPKMTKQYKSVTQNHEPLQLGKVKLDQAIKRVLQLPTVGSKKFLITIGDRTVGGLTVRDQMVGPWQVPVADVAVTAASFGGVTGEAMAMGERAPLALVDAAASARMAVGEALTNIAAAPVAKLRDVKLSANWMAASGHGHQDQNLFEAVKAVGEEFAPALGLTIPVGKDSLSMRTKWQQDGAEQSVVSPLSLVISAFSPVKPVTQTLTPQLQPEGSLILIDLGQGQNRLAGSALAQVYSQLGNQVPDAQAAPLKKFFTAIQKLNKQGKLLAYHDRSDGGLLATLLEMAFAARSGLQIDLTKLPGSTLEKLFNEELGAVIQVASKDRADVLRQLRQSLDNVYEIGQPAKDQTINLKDGAIEYSNSRAQLEQWWASTSYQIQSLRDNQQTAKQEYDQIKATDGGLFAKVTAQPLRQKYTKRPKVAIFREEGVNGQTEMAAAFDLAGFTAVDVHLNDLLDGRTKLDDFVGLAACGGFSYGDVLGAGEGWAKTILLHPQLRQAFQSFFERPDTFSLGVCNGCQMLSTLKELIPGAQDWPRFLKNTSEQFEARLVMVKVEESPSILFKNMAGSCLPVPVAHGEGRAAFDGGKRPPVALRYVDSQGQPTQNYPANPNGSPSGITALTTPDGRATIMMPHPERAFLTQQLSWHPADWPELSPWLRLFQNARDWVDQQS